MSFEEIWQEHRKFILSLVAGVLVFFVAWSILEGSYEKDIQADQRAIRASNNKAKMQRLAPGRMSAVNGELETLEQTLAGLESELAFRPQEGFTLEGVTRSPDVHFNDTVEKLMEVVELALSLDIRVQPDLGIGGVTPKTNAEREWYLNGLDIVRRIVVAGVASGVRSIEPVQISSPPSKKRRGRRAAVDQVYCRELPVKFTATGHPAAIDGMVRGLMQPGSRLAIDRASISSMDDPDGKKQRSWGEQLVKIEVTVKALLVDTEGVPQDPPTTRL